MVEKVTNRGWNVKAGTRVGTRGGTSRAAVTMSIKVIIDLTETLFKLA
jgi:hypothetical protein